MDSLSASSPRRTCAGSPGTRRMRLNTMTDTKRSVGSVSSMRLAMSFLTIRQSAQRMIWVASVWRSPSCVSKAYGVPGILLGWHITSNPKLQELFLAAKVQMSICGSILHEWIGEKILLSRSAILDVRLKEMRRRRHVVEDWMCGEDLLDWSALPVVSSVSHVCARCLRSGTDAFYKRLMEYGTYVAPSRWFEIPDRCFRLGYGWSSASELEHALQGISKAWRG
jgi:aspartate/methionine/tyrosine aminotransferase